MCASIVQLLGRFHWGLSLLVLYLTAVGSVFILAAISSRLIRYRTVNDIYGDATGCTHRLWRGKTEKGLNWVNNDNCLCVDGRTLPCERGSSTAKCVRSGVCVFEDGLNISPTSRPKLSWEQPHWDPIFRPEIRYVFKPANKGTHTIYWSLSCWRILDK